MKILFFLILTSSLAGCYSSEPHKTGKEGQPMPKFSILLTDSTTWITPNQESINKPMAIFYFSPYCPFCKAQTEQLVKDMDRLKNIQFYLISRFPITAIKEYQQKYQLAKYPNIISGMDTATFMTDYFEMPGVPFWAIYNKNKKLSQSFLGKIYSSKIIKAAEE
jgi:thiol-disulfide isomerase/thioredoxin